MKIRDLLPVTYELLSKEKISRPRFVSSNDNLLLKRAIFLDRKHTLQALERLFKDTYSGNQTASLPTIKPFKQLLTERWEYLQNTNLCYTYSNFIAVNRICSTLAQELSESKFFDEHPFKMLMPTIDTFNQVTLTDLSESAINLNHFVLSDDNAHIIHVQDCISDMQEDGILKHTSVLQNKKLKPLSTDERVRVIHHSKESFEYYETIRTMYEIKNEGESIGAAVKRLTVQLRSGGERGGRDGTAFLAGTDALNGIKDFYQFLKILDNEEQENVLFACSSFRNATGSSFEFCWYHLLIRTVLNGQIQLPESELFVICEFLANPSHATSQVPCVELIAGDLERILNNHHELFEMFPKDKDSANQTSIKICEARIAEAHKRLEDKSLSDQFQTVLNYAEDGDINTINQIYRALIKTPTDLKSILNDLPVNLYPRFLFEVLQASRVQKIILTFKEFYKLLNDLVALDGYEFVIKALGKEHILSFLQTSDELNMLFKSFTKGQALAFLDEILDKESLKQLYPNNNPNEIIELSFDDEVKKKMLTMLDQDPNLVVPSLYNFFTLFTPAAPPIVQEEKPTPTKQHQL